jgi:hypothetical protein
MLANPARLRIGPADDAARRGVFTRPGRLREALAMSTAQMRTGRCLCGGVAFSVTGRLRQVVNCHCERCRRFTGHHLAATAAALEDVRIEDPTQALTWYPVEGAEYGFCRTCGSSLFWRAESSPDRLSICAGCLEPPTGLGTIEAWWVSQASDYFIRPDLPEHLTE